ncbi:hypothetical protein [Nonomuraea sp. NPDC052265]|uniref:GNAT family N-acetyltransferase, cg3035/Rv0428c family n=1 Tax=Nonomuraea sp. NPDC052265 TaxID=3364374 RepID=UPI0037CAB223
MNVDPLVHQAWPAYEQRSHDGWVLRSAGGVTKRANSVLALNAPTDLDAAIGAAEAFYGERGQSCAFSVGRGTWPGLDAELARRGYELNDPTVVMAGSRSAGSCRRATRRASSAWRRCRGPGGAGSRVRCCAP